MTYKITDIKNPDFLKGLEIDDLTELASDIRNFLIESIAKTGGHLSSNLGVVELTIALHYVFDFKTDKLLLDVGHQSYTHKILTGRTKDFDSLRKYHGLSGFQKRHESPYDCFEAGHSSTSLSAALGMAVARDLKKETYEIVPLIGDGALLSGMAMEALNNIGFEKKKIIIIFNDNDMSISHNVGAVSKGFSNLRNSKQYNELKVDVKDFLRKNEKYGKSLISLISSFKNSIKKQVVDSGIFKEFNLDYHGPIDGHNIKELVRALEVAKENDQPCVVHVVTKKGKGYEFAENDYTGTWHGVGPFDVEKGRPLVQVPCNYKSYSKLVADTVENLMFGNEKIVTITPAMMAGAKLEDIFAHFPDRSFDCGIAEEHAVTFAAGLALNGMRPFISIYSSFLQRAYDQVNHDVCRMDLPVVFGIDRAGLVGEDGETHHGIFDISFLRAIPNIIISQGRDAKEIEDLIFTAFSQNHPFAIRYPRGNTLYNGNLKALKQIPIGTWEYIIDVDDAKATILSYGNEINELEALIKENNYAYNLVNCRFLKPIDESIIERLVLENRPVFVFEGDMLIGGLSSAIGDYLTAKNSFLHMDVTGIPDLYPQQGSNLQLQEELGIDIRTFLNHVKEKIND